jgi:hypothetical protein
MSELSREENVFMAKLYESTEKFDKMVECINAYVVQNPVLNKEEVNLLSSGYKNVINRKRIAWRDLVTKNNEDLTTKKKKAEIVAELKKEAEDEIISIADRLLVIIEKYLIPNAKTDENKVLFLKMKADFYRYKAEITDGKDYEENHKLSESAYSEGYKLSEQLPISNPVRMGLTLNFSVLYYEVKLQRDKALSIAEKAYAESLTIIDELDKTLSKDTLLIIQLLKDNISKWKNDGEEESDI